MLPYKHHATESGCTDRGQHQLNVDHVIVVQTMDQLLSVNSCQVENGVHIFAKQNHYQQPIVRRSNEKIRILCGLLDEFHTSTLIACDWNHHISSSENVLGLDSLTHQAWFVRVGLTSISTYINVTQASSFVDLCMLTISIENRVIHAYWGNCTRAKFILYPFVYIKMHLTCVQVQ